MGSHAELFARGGANYHGIDLTDRAIEMTTTRLALRGLSGEVQQMDAEHMTFADDSFDFVWSWGVIHHSSDPSAILREMLRVLRPVGEVKLMVCNRRSINAGGTVARGYLTGKARSMDRDQMMSHYVDGFVARHYDERSFSDLITSCGFAEVRTTVLGQTIEMLPVPGAGPLGPAKQAATRVIPKGVTLRVLGRAGFFLFASAHKPS